MIVIEFYAWFATTWQDGHVGSRHNSFFSRRIYIKMVFSSRGEKCFCSWPPTWPPWRHVLTSIRVFSLKWPAALKTSKNKRKILRKKGSTPIGLAWNIHMAAVSLFTTPIWRAWRHVKTFYIKNSKRPFMVSWSEIPPRCQLKHCVFQRKEPVRWFFGKEERLYFNYS